MLNWMVVVEWPDNSHSFAEVPGGDKKPNPALVFSQFDFEGSPFSAKIWFCPAKSRMHVGQTRNGEWVHFEGDRDIPLTRFSFPVGYKPFQLDEN